MEKSVPFSPLGGDNSIATIKISHVDGDTKEGGASTSMNGSFTSDDDDRDVCYIVEDKEFYSYKTLLVKHSGYFREVIESLKTSKKNYRILLPKWVGQEAFTHFLKFL